MILWTRFVLMACLLFIAVSCFSAGTTGLGTGSEMATDTDTGPDSDTDSETDTDTETETTTETITDTEVLNWWLHRRVESLVYVAWPQWSAGSVHVEYELDGEWHNTPSFYAEAGLQIQLIVGIPFATDAPWRVVQESTGEVEEGDIITTGPVPDKLPIPKVVVADEENWLQSGKYLLSSINEKTGGWTTGGHWAIIIDRKGRPIWAQKTPLRRWTIYVQVAQSGDHILWDEATRWSDFDDGAGSKVHFSYLDKEIKVVDTPGLHHAFVQLPDGTLAWGSQYHGGNEALVEKPPGATDETIIWTAAGDWPGVDTSQRFETNCLYYVKHSDTYLLSFYTNHTVLEVDRSSGSSQWWAGRAPGSYTFVPRSSQFDWQHGVTYLGDGNMLLSSDFNDTTWAREYAIDHDKKTLSLVWNYDSGIAANTNGDVRRLPNGNTLHLVGGVGLIIEVQHNGNIVWRVQFPGERLLGRGEFVQDLYALISP